MDRLFHVTLSAFVRATAKLRRSPALFAFTILASCNDYSSGSYQPPFEPPASVITSVRIEVETTSLDLGQGTAIFVTALDQFGRPMDAPQPTFNSSHPDVAIFSPTRNAIVAISPGSTTITAAIGAQSANIVMTVVGSLVKINEVRPNAEAPSGWIELFNQSNTDVDLSNWALSGNDTSRALHFLPGTFIAARGFLVVDERDIPNGLSSIETAHLYNDFGAQVDAFAWATSPNTSFARCPDGAGQFTVAFFFTRRTPNICTNPQGIRTN